MVSVSTTKGLWKASRSEEFRDAMADKAMTATIIAAIY